jgi:hypothetical protein
MAGPARRGDGGLQRLGEVQSEGEGAPTTRWRRREGAVANMRRIVNGREERELGGCSRGRGRGDARG